MTALLVALGAAVGAPLRFLLELAVQRRFEASSFPWGTLGANAAGCLALGSLMALPLSPEATALWGVGLCGALTTYSSFSYQAYRLAATGRRRAAALYVAASLGTGLGAAWAGIVLTGALLG